ncbi:MAG: hypothetical protein ACMXYL_00140 [Candidatus Woesearchaeota archaeon]
MKTTILILLGVFSISIIFLIILVMMNPGIFDLDDRWDAGLEEACEKHGGEWSSLYKECSTYDSGADIEGFCLLYGGMYNGCASACRHALLSVGCIDVCVQVCELS